MVCMYIQYMEGGNPNFGAHFRDVFVVHTRTGTHSDGCVLGEHYPTLINK